jgi:hypothetical protein
MEQFLSYLSPLLYLTFFEPYSIGSIFSMLSLNLSYKR